MPSREAFIYIPESLKLAFYAVSLLCLLIFITGIYFRFSIWLKGREESSDPLSAKGIAGMVLMSLRYFFSRDCLMARRVMIKSKLRGAMLIFVYWGFTALFTGTIIVGFDHYLGLGILRGYFYLFFSFLLDLSGLALLTGTIFFILRRVTTKKDMVSGWDDLPILIILLIIVLSGFSVEGTRLAIINPESMDWSFVGAIFSNLLMGISNPVTYLFFWSVHVISALCFIAFIPFSKQFHMFAAQITTQGALLRGEDLKRLVHEEVKG